MEVADQRTLLSQKAEQQEISQWGHPVRTCDAKGWFPIPTVHWWLYRVESMREKQQTMGQMIHPQKISMEHNQHNQHNHGT